MHHYSLTLDSQDPNNLPQNPNVCLSPRAPGQAFKYVSFPFRSRSPIRTRCLCLWARPPTPTISLAFGAEDTLCLEPASLFLEIFLYALYIAAMPSCQPRRMCLHFHSIYYPVPPHCSHTLTHTEPKAHNTESASTNEVFFPPLGYLSNE